MGVLRQGPCPYCASSDAFTEYDDGGVHCFSCGKHQPGNAYKKMMEKLTTTLKPVVGCPELPEDTTNVLDPRATAWVKKYGITDAEIDENKMLWSEEKQLLIFPVLNEVGEVLMWQGRYFGPKKTHPKYLTRGLKESLVHIIGQDKPGPLVLTEDLISSIKVGRQQPAMPIWGSAISAELVQQVRLLYPHVVLWLDFDKRDTSIKLAMKHCLWIHIDPLITQLDPKCHSDLEIAKFLKGQND